MKMNMDAKQLYNFKKHNPDLDIVIEGSLSDGAHETMLLPVKAVKTGYYDEWGEVVDPPAGDPSFEEVVFVDVGFGKGLVFDMHEPVHAYRQTLRKLP